MFSGVSDIGEPLFITDIYNTLNEVDGVVDTVNVDIISKNGDSYSKPFNITKPIGKEFHYSGAGYQVIQQVLEEITNKRLYQLLEQSLMFQIFLTPIIFLFLIHVSELFFDYLISNFAYACRFFFAFKISIEI